MFDMNLVLGLAIGALAAAGIVYAITSSGWRRLNEQISAAQSALAVAESRVSDLTAKSTQLETTNQRLATDNLRLATERERLEFLALAAPFVHRHQTYSLLVLSDAKDTKSKEALRRVLAELVGRPMRA